MLRWVDKCFTYDSFFLCYLVRPSAVGRFLFCHSPPCFWVHVIHKYLCASGKPSCFCSSCFYHHGGCTPLSLSRNVSVAASVPCLDLLGPSSQRFCCCIRTSFWTFWNKNKTGPPEGFQVRPPSADAAGRRQAPERGCGRAARPFRSEQCPSHPGAGFGRDRSARRRQGGGRHQRAGGG